MNTHIAYTRFSSDNESLSSLPEPSETSYSSIDANATEPAPETRGDAVSHSNTSASQPTLPAPFSTGGHDMLMHENILRDIISDEQYHTLRKMGLLNEKVLRDVHIRKTFRELRAQHLSAHQAIERLQALYPYLQFDTLRKIVYQIHDTKHL
ncbi:MAG: hypothetical protein RML40_08415 [Bacteroidota bacterium]|nr:hypothetical protein [Candidatus Kapabacteria bacterium]MDW8220539.1 hypothetical protein [Bacteroidota bacterium]